MLAIKFNSTSVFYHYRLLAFANPCSSLWDHLEALSALHLALQGHHPPVLFSGIQWSVRPQCLVCGMPGINCLLLPPFTWLIFTHPLGLSSNIKFLRESTESSLSHNPQNLLISTIGEVLFFVYLNSAQYLLPDCKYMKAQDIMLKNSLSRAAISMLATW